MRAASGRRALPVLMHPAFVIIVIVAAVHLIRSALVDALVFFLVAAALLFEQAWVGRHVDRRPPSGAAAGLGRPRTEVVAVLATAVAFGWVAGRWQLYDWRLKVATAIAGVLVALLVVAHRPPDGAAPVRPARLGWLWAAVAVAICLQELASFVQQPDPTTGVYEHPTLSFLLEPLLASPLVRGCVLAGWLVAGYYLLRRAGLLGRTR